jgi:tetratricopeptide (TPR) repeat protein
VLAGRVRAASDDEARDIAVARGISRINEGRTRDALAEFERALALSPADPEALYYAAAAHASLGNHAEAERLLNRAVDAAGAAPDLCYELGWLSYRRADMSRAEDFFRQFLRSAEGDDRRALAARMARHCREQRLGYAVSAHAFVGAEYDSNVPVQPENPPYESEDPADYRAFLFATVDGTLWRGRPVEGAVRYAFYQSMHDRLADFGVQYHKVGSTLALNALGPFRPSVGGAYEYTLYGGERYGDARTATGTLAVREGRRFSTEACYEGAGRQYWDSDLFPRNSEMNGPFQAMGLVQKLSTGALQTEVYGFLDSLRADERYWAYDGWRGGARLAAAIAKPLHLRVSAEYEDRRYLAPPPSDEDDRHDEVWHFGLGLTLRLSDRWCLVLTESYTLSASNWDLSDYERSVTGLSFGASMP